MLDGIDLNIMPDEIRMFLCRPDRTTILELYNFFGLQRSLNYGGINQLTFKIPYRTKNAQMQFVRNIDVDLTTGDFLIRYECGSVTEYYIITKYVNNYSDGKETMNVECNFLPFELSYRVVQLYKDTKKLYDTVGTDSILHDTLLSLTDWTIGYCNTQAAIKYRTFDVSQTDLLSFLNQVATTYNLILAFDSVNKTVSFYNEDEYGVDEGLVIDEQYLKSLQETENHSEIVTRLWCYGKDNLTLVSVNPSGNSYLEDFSFYMYPYTEDTSGNVLTSSYYMSDSLCHAITQYNKLVSNQTTNFNSLLTQRNDLVNSEIPYKALKVQYEADMDTINASIDIAVKNGQSLTTLNSQKSSKQTQIDGNQASIDSIESQIATIDSQITTLRNTLSIANNFTTAQIIEKNKFIREKVWIDTKYVDPVDLYIDGAARLKLVSQPTLAYEIDSIDMLRQLNSNKDWNRLKIGSVITVRFEDFGINFDLNVKSSLNQYGAKKIKSKVINIVHSIDDHSVKITIANNKNIRSGILKLADLLTKSVSTGASFDFSKGNWDQGKDANDTVTAYINNALDAAKQSVISGVNNSTQVDNRGITTTDTSDANKILRINAGGIYISSDGQQTFKTAITASGVVADVLAGNIVLSNNLLVSNTAGTVSINGSGMTVSDMTLSIKRSDNKSRILLDSTNGIKIQSGDGTVGTIWTDKFSTDTNGNISITGNINATSGSFSGSVNCTALSINGTNVLNGSQISGNYIDSINANKINVGTLTGFTIVGTTIQGGTISSNTSIDVGTNLYVGDNINLTRGSSGTQSIISNGNGSITFRSNGMTIAANMQIDLSSSFVTYNGSEIATKSWVTTNAVAKFA